MNLFPIACLFAAASLSACASDPSPKSGTLAESTQDIGQDAVLFPARLAAQVRFLGYDQAEGYWTPAAQDVQALDRNLRSELERAMMDPASVDPWVEGQPDAQAWNRGETALILEHLDQYRRQYFGLIGPDGRKQILVRCFPAPGATDGFDFPRWKEEIAIVSDGGYWYWYAVYDVESGKLVRLDSNGYA